MTDQPLFDVGHNSAAAGPELLLLAMAAVIADPVSDAAGRTRARLELFRTRRDQFLEAAKKVEIKDRIDAGSAADLIGLARDVRGMIDSVRLEIGRPHLDASRAVNAACSDFWGVVDEAMEDVQAKLDTFAKEERDRARQLQEEQAAEEQRRRAAIAGPGAPPPAPAPMKPAKPRSFRGDYGRQAIVTDDDEIEIEDVRALPDMILEAEAVREAIIRVVKPMVKQKMKIPGIRVTAGVKTSVRK